MICELQKNKCPGCGEDLDITWDPGTGKATFVAQHDWEKQIATGGVWDEKSRQYKGGVKLIEGVSCQYCNLAMGLYCHDRVRLMLGSLHARVFHPQSNQDCTDISYPARGQNWVRKAG